jgi:fatty acid amide hydrolase
MSLPNQKWLSLTAEQVQNGLDTGKWTSLDIIQNLFKRIDQVNPIINGFTQVFKQEAFDLAKKRDQERSQDQIRGPFHGLPITVKENIQIKGLPCTLGIKSLKLKISPRDADMVAWFQELGAIVIGRTNIPQALIPMDCTNPIYGTTLNPWHPEHVTGGSSGGEAAVIASQMSYLGIGTDLGGSVRFPAGFCGISALMPTLDALPNYGFAGAAPGQNVIRGQIGLMAKNISDIRWAMQLLHTNNQKTRCVHLPPLDFTHRFYPKKKLRIGVIQDDGFIQPAPVMTRATQEVQNYLEKEGHEIIPVHPTNTKKFLSIYLRAVSADGLNTLRKNSAGSPISSVLKDVWRYAKIPVWLKKLIASLIGPLGEKRVAEMMKYTQKSDVSSFWSLEMEKREFIKDELDWWQKHELDLLLTPASATPAPMRGLEKEMSLIFSYYGKYNLLGFPAGVVPVSKVLDKENYYPHQKDIIDKKISKSLKYSTGLPLGVQVVGAPWSDYTVLKLLVQIQGYCSQQPHYPKKAEYLEKCIQPSPIEQNSTIQQLAN